MAVVRGYLHNQLNLLIDRPGVRRLACNFAAHLATEFPAVFTFLLEPDAIDATNWRAEHGLRPAVVTRKSAAANAPPEARRPNRCSPASSARFTNADSTRRRSSIVCCDPPRPITVLAPPTAAALH